MKEAYCPLPSFFPPQGSRGKSLTFHKLRKACPQGTAGRWGRSRHCCKADGAGRGGTGGGRSVGAAPPRPHPSITLDNTQTRHSCSGASMNNNKQGTCQGGALHRRVGQRGRVTRCSCPYNVITLLWNSNIPFTSTLGNKIYPIKRNKDNIVFVGLRVQPRGQPWLHTGCGGGHTHEPPHTC